MTRAMQAHPRLGAVPATWRVGRVGRYVEFRSGQVDPEDESFTNHVLIAPNHIESRTGRLLSTETAADQGAESGKYWCDEGDVIYSKIRPGLRKVTLAPFDCLCSADMYPLKGIRGMTNRYLKWFLLSEPFSDFAEQESARVAMPKLNRETLGEAAIPLPNVPEQECIANFLDEQTARIDALIAEKHALNALLEEEKQACIDRAVFGAVEPPLTFPFVPESQVLGGATWSRCMLKHKWQVTDCKHLTVEFRDEGFPIASIREVSSGTLNLKDAKRASEADYRNLSEGARRPKRGDLIYARNASVGAVALVDTDEPFSMGQDVCLITSSTQDQAFLRLQLMSSPLKAQLESLLQGATIRRINVEQIRSFSVFVPPLSVQREMVVRTFDALSRRESLQQHIEEHVERLREYRSSLISAAVTGQLDLGDSDTWREERLAA